MAPFFPFPIAKYARHIHVCATPYLSAKKVMKLTECKTFNLVAELWASLSRLFVWRVFLLYLDCEAPKSLHHISHFRWGTSNARKTDPIKNLSKSNITQQADVRNSIDKREKEDTFQKSCECTSNRFVRTPNITEIIFLSQECAQDAIAKFRLAVHCACRNPPRKGALFSSVEGLLLLFISSEQRFSELPPPFRNSAQHTIILASREKIQAIVIFLSITLERTTRR